MTPQRVLTIFTLIVAGEAIFGLPFHVIRYFRPTFVEVFGLSQTQLGVLGSIYGVTAMISYLAGGALADRLPVKHLLAGSLLATGAAGIWFAMIPSYSVMCVVYGFWGVSTILTFWAALIKATRQWGGDQEQGEAFGLLDGGRGMYAAVMAFVAIGVFRFVLPEGADDASPEQRALAIQNVIALYAIACAVAAAFVWWFIPDDPGASEETARAPLSRGRLFDVLRRPAIWLQALIILAAYSAFKGIDFYSQYAKDVWGWSDEAAAGLSAWSSWVRPVAAIGAGLLADRLGSSRVLSGLFLLSGAAYLFLTLAPPASGSEWMLWAGVLTCCFGFFAMRGVYFALLEESDIPPEITGTAVGVVSFIGFTPEVFMPLLGGWLIDRWDGGPMGYHVLFVFLAVVSAVGVGATLALKRLNRVARL